jgi:hypothetical protein
MTVFYRLCDIKSPLSVKPPILMDDQFKLNELCLKSFVLAFGDISPKVIFILDHCPKEKYQALIDSVPFEHEEIWTNIGINDTCLLQYELASTKSDDVILFQECDYLYRPLSGKMFEKAILKYGLVSPYDHRNFYIDRTIHSKDCQIDLIDEQHFRTTERNTMTFGMTKEVFEKNFEILKRWGYLDNEVWKEMRANGNPLWVPIPAFATHMVEGFLSPGLDWAKLWGMLLK